MVDRAGKHLDREEGLELGQILHKKGKHIKRQVQMTQLEVSQCKVVLTNLRK